MAADRLTVRMDADVLSIIDKRRGSISRSRWVAMACREYVESGLPESRHHDVIALDAMRELLIVEGRVIYLYIAEYNRIWAQKKNLRNLVASAAVLVERLSSIHVPPPRKTEKHLVTVHSRALIPVLNSAADKSDISVSNLVGRSVRHSLDIPDPGEMNKVGAAVRFQIRRIEVNAGRAVNLMLPKLSEDIAFHDRLMNKMSETHHETVGMVNDNISLLRAGHKVLSELIDAAQEVRA